MAMEALGRLVDVSTGTLPVDLAAGAQTGARVSLKKAESVLILVVLGAAGAGTDDLTLTLKQHTAASGGTSSNLAVVDHYYRKAEATLDGDETWTRVTQTAAATVTVAGASLATQQVLLAIEVHGTQLSDTYDYISVDVADPGTNARLGAVLFVLHDLKVQRKPENLSAPLS